MRLVAFRGTVSTPVSGNAELQSLRILAAITQSLEMEGARSISHSPNRYIFKGGFRERTIDSTLVPFIKMVSSGEINVSQTINQQVIAYRIYFDELALVIFGLSAFFTIVSFGALFLPLLIAGLGFFLLIAVITIIRFRRFLFSCIAQANA
jgi:hypothetical protein